MAVRQEYFLADVHCAACSARDRQNETAI